jgi:hypothetical protein
MARVREDRTGDKESSAVKVRSSEFQLTILPMQALKNFIAHHGLFCLLLIILAVSALAYYSHRVSTIDLVPLTTLAVTAVLAAITWQYVRTTQETLAILKEQWEYQRKIEIRFGVSIKEEKPWARIVNPGGVRFWISKVVFSKLDHSPYTIMPYTMVGPGEKRGFFIPKGVYKDDRYYCDVNITLHYEPYGQAERIISRAFRIELSNGKIQQILRGVQAWRFVPCPTCNQKMIMMNTENLENFEKALEREADFKSQLKATCPQHDQSLWVENIDTVRARNNREKEQGFSE